MKTIIGLGASYERIAEGHPAFGRLKAFQEAGVWMCDAVDHNSGEGCPNPDCFNRLKG